MIQLYVAFANNKLLTREAMEKCRHSGGSQTAPTLIFPVTGILYLQRSERNLFFIPTSFFPHQMSISPGLPPSHPSPIPSHPPVQGCPCECVYLLTSIQVSGTWVEIINESFSHYSRSWSSLFLNSALHVEFMKFKALQINLFALSDDLGLCWDQPSSWFFPLCWLDHIMSYTQISPHHYYTQWTSLRMSWHHACVSYECNLLIHRCVLAFPSKEKKWTYCLWFWGLNGNY